MSISTKKEQDLTPALHIYTTLTYNGFTPFRM